MVNDTNTQFIDHIIFIMRNVLESKPENQPPENLGQTSIETMMLTIVRYVRHLVRKDTLRMRFVIARSDRLSSSRIPQCWPYRSRRVFVAW